MHIYIEVPVAAVLLPLLGLVAGDAVVVLYIYMYIYEYIYMYIYIDIYTCASNAQGTTGC